MSDSKRSGRQIKFATPETILKIHDTGLTDRRLKMREIVEAIGIRRDSLVSVLNDHLRMEKLSARCVRRLLTTDQTTNVII